MQDFGGGEGLQEDIRSFGKGSMKHDHQWQSQKKHKKTEDDGDESAPNPERFRCCPDVSVCPGVTAGRVSKINEASHGVSENFLSATPISETGFPMFEVHCQ